MAPDHSRAGVNRDRLQDRPEFRAAVAQAMPANVATTEAVATAIAAASPVSASTTQQGLVELATSSESTAGLAVQASDTRLKTIEEEGTPVTSRTNINFVGAGVSVSDTGGKTQVSIPGGAGEAFPVGSVFIAVVSTNPATLLGYGTWSSFGAGRVMVGLDSGDTDFDTVEETGGSKAVASSAQTIGGSTAAEAAHTHSVTSNVTVADHASHTHTYTEVPNHVHGVSTILRTATTGAATTQVTNAQDTSSTADTTRKTDNPDGGVAAGTTNGPSATLSHTPTNNAVTSGAGSSHSHGAGTLANTPGAATSVVQPYIVCYFWKRTA